MLLFDVWICESCVLEENMEGHLKRCPLLKQTQTLSLQPYYQKGINQGTDSEDQDVQFTSEMKRNWVYNLSAPLFYDLLSKIRSLHASICKDMQFSYKIPNACDIWIKRQNDRYVYIMYWLSIFCCFNCIVFEWLFVYILCKWCFLVFKYLWFLFL